MFTVTKGAESISEPILFCFGQGKAGQTYVFRHDGLFYQSRISFFNDISGLDYTIGSPREAPQTITEALGNEISADEAQNCFGCHSTGAVRDNRLQLDQMTPGVGCEACHGPGEKHIAEMKSQKQGETFILNPAKLDTDELAQEVCGACHRSVEEVSRLPQLGGGINNVRFQPYRLFNSPGHNPTDARLSCSTCHDVHTNQKHDVAFYDARCFACHQSGTSIDKSTFKSPPVNEQPAKPCPVAKQNCVSCHMPQVEIPGSGSHFKFTDHRIRIVRPGDKYPN
jgi:DnaJ-class molecular chaperone